MGLRSRSFAAAAPSAQSHSTAPSLRLQHELARIGPAYGEQLPFVERVKDRRSQNGIMPYSDRSLLGLDFNGVLGEQIMVSIAHPAR